MIRHFLAALAMVLPLAGATALAADGHGHQKAGVAELGPLTVSEARARASIGRAPNSAVYLTITTSGEPDRLIAAASPTAQHVEIHRSFMEDGVMKMAPVDGITVTSENPANLEPRGHHIMLMGLVEPLPDGGEIDVTLTFEQAGEVTLRVPVRKLRGHSH